MRALKSIAVGILTVLAVSGCTSSMTSEPVASFDQAEQPLDPGKARIYVLRISTTNSYAAGRVKDGDRLIGSLRPNTYLCWDREPGETVIRSSWMALLAPKERSEDIHELSLKVEGGKAYYLMQQWRLGKPPTKLAVLEEEYARTKLAGCKPAKVAGE